MSRSPLSAFARALLAATSLVALATFVSPARAQVWTEVGDAGPLPGTAQHTVGTGPLVEISGGFQSPDDVDLYCINVGDVAGFAANLQCSVNEGPDLWLFNAAGQGVAATQLCAAGAKSMDGTLLPGPGNYLIGVSFDADYPFQGSLGLWAFGYTPQRAPDGPGAALPVASWSGFVNVVPHSSPYRILLAGATFCDAPTPAQRSSWGGVKSIYR